MNSNRWFKLVAISFVGIFAAYALLWLGQTIIPNQSTLTHGSYYQQDNLGYQQYSPQNGQYYMGMPPNHGSQYGSNQGQMMPNQMGMNMQGGGMGMGMMGNMQGGMGMGMGMHH